MILFVFVILLILAINIRLCILLCLSPMLKAFTLRQKHASQHLTPDAISGDLPMRNEASKLRTLKSKAALYIGSFHSRLAVKWIGDLCSHRIRNWFYRRVLGIEIGNAAVLYHGAEIRAPWKLKIKKGTIIGDNAILDASKGISIGENVNISSRVSIYTLQHDYRDSGFKCTEEHYGPVTVGDRAWLGPNCIILPGVTIGEGSVVAGGAVVTKSIPPYEVWGGVPARRIAVRPRNMTYEFDGFHPHFL